MREERGRVSGDIIVFEPFTLWGQVAGNVKVIQGGKFYLRGTIYGDLTVEYGGRVHVFGNVVGNLSLERGAKVVHSGIISGDVTNTGGRLFIEPTAQIGGKIKTRHGETKVTPLPGTDPTPQ